MMRLLTLFLLPLASLASSGKFTVGERPDFVVALNANNLDEAIRDPKNTFWLLKFYAPWCGHCKKLLPVLDSVAPKTAGKMSIGTIDCTIEKALCDKHGVRGYPTLKYAMDGDIMDYPGGRSEQNFIDFTSRMLGPPVDLTPSVEEAHKLAETAGADGVAFLAHHPAAAVPSNESLDDKLASTKMTQVYAQVARKMRSVAGFFLLDTSANDENAPAAASGQLGDGPFICRIENGVEPRCFPKVLNFDASELQAWIESNNMPTVSQLSSHNFYKIGRKGRPLCIAVVADHDNSQMDLAKQALTKYAVSGDPKIREKYYYGIINGKQWKRFLEQFNVAPNKLPQVFALSVTKKTYWQNATYALNVDDFLRDIERGIISSRKAGKGGVEGFFEQVLGLILDFAPYSFIGILLLLLLVVIGIVRFLTPGKDLRPPYPRKNDDGKQQQQQDEKEETKARDETKKDK